MTDAPSRSAAQQQPAAPSLLLSALHSLENAWLASASYVGCVDLPVEDQDLVDEVVQNNMQQAVKLRTGASIPVIGLGVYQMSPGEETYQAVLSALRLGYRHIDTAQIYRNEENVGQAIADSGIPREELFVTTKVWKAAWGAGTTKASVRESLERLRTPYADLVLLHAPGDPALRAETWADLEDCVAEGSVRAIGVSNFGIPHLERLAETANVPPAVNQIELHPFLQWWDLVSYCQEQGIVVEAYSPLCKGHKMEDPVLKEVATKLGVTPAQVLIRWSLQKGYVPLVKSSNPDRQRTNLDVFKFAIPDEEMAKLDALDCKFITGWNPIEDDPV